MVTKKCSSCRTLKKITEFHKCHRNKDGLLYSCKICISNKRRGTESSKLYYLNNKEEILLKNKRRRKKNPDKAIDIRLRSWYSITKAQYDCMSNAQDHKCKICNKLDKLVVDHSHATGKVRGLLCSRCNQGLGLFKEDKFALENAIEYLNAK